LIIFIHFLSFRFISNVNSSLVFWGGGRAEPENGEAIFWLWIGGAVRAKRTLQKPIIYKISSYHLPPVFKVNFLFPTNCQS